MRHATTNANAPQGARRGSRSSSAPLRWQEAARSADEERDRGEGDGCKRHCRGDGNGGDGSGGGSNGGGGGMLAAAAAVAAAHAASDASHASSTSGAPLLVVVVAVAAVPAARELMWP